MSFDNEDLIDCSVDKDDLCAIKDAVDALLESEDEKINKPRITNKRKRTHYNSNGSSEGSVKKTNFNNREIETDESILNRRQKQIEYGKNTAGYANYKNQVNVEDRKRDDPQTPDKYRKYSRRSWDMLIKTWRKKLHKYDPDGVEA